MRDGDRVDAADGIVRDINLQRAARRQLAVFLAGSALLALVAAANTSLFLLARGPGRQRELGIRMAVGASLRRLMRQLATEATVLVAVAGVLGLFLSVWFIAYLRSTALFQGAEWRDVTLFDWRVLSLAGTALLILALLSSVAPVLDLRRRGIAESSSSVVAWASPAQRVICVTQVSAAGIFAGVAIAFGWFVFPMLFGNPGYETSDRYVVQGTGEVYGRQGASEVVLPRRREVIESIPGVTAIGFGSPVPTWGFDYLVPVPIVNPADPMNPIDVGHGTADPEFFDLLEFRMIFGSAPDVSDGNGVLINQALANQLWHREDVVGEVLTALSGTQEIQLGVTGVLEDFSFSHPASPVPPALFVSPSSVLSNYRLVSVIETELTAAELRQELEREIAAGRLEISLRGDIEPLQAMRNDLLGPDRARSFLTVATAALVVLLAAFGLYGMQHFLVAASRREFAIRASVGAGPRSLERLVYVRAVLLGLPGIVLGSLLAFIVVLWLQDRYLSREIVPGIVAVAVVSGLTLLLVGASVGPAREVKNSKVAPLLSED
jgi:ABC-type antimicrobial peptide transport system permease subunit